MKRSLSNEAIASLVAPLAAANRRFAGRYPGESGGRQPVHTVYGGAHLFQRGLCAKLGVLALTALDQYAPDADTLAQALGMPPEVAAVVRPRVVEKLRREPVEDFRIDFEDGYGTRPAEEEDGHAVAAGNETAAALEAGSIPPFFGIRIKPLNEELRDRSIRTLDLFLTALAGKSGGRLPGNFVVTLPKVTVPEQVSALAALLDMLETQLGFAAGALQLELMVETPQAVLRLEAMLDAAGGRCAAAHFGPYDYTASLSIAAAQQQLDHAACDFARSRMQAVLAGTRVRLSDGPFNILPVAPHRGAPLSPSQLSANREAIHRAWRLHYGYVRRSLAHAFYQSWDLHPAQLPARYAAVYAFFYEGLDASSRRLRNFMAKAAQATLAGDIFDDAATGQGLLNFFLRAIDCGAIPEAEAPALTGLAPDELRTASFTRIIRGRHTGDQN